MDKNYATFKQVEYKYTESGGRLYKNEFRSMDSDQLFPGYLDIGTPLIIKKYYDRHHWFVHSPDYSIPVTFVFQKLMDRGVLSTL